MYLKIIFVVFVMYQIIHPSNMSRTPSRNIRATNPCSKVSCFYNSLCVIDPSTDEPICECPKNECDGVASFPVCAGGITFKSACHAQTYMCEAQEWLTIQHVGPCGVQECEPGKTCQYNGECVDGTCECQECDESERQKFLDIEPMRHTSVCGSDGITYESECQLRYQSCMSRTLIAIQRHSACHRRVKSPVARNAPLRSLYNHFEVWQKTFDKSTPSVPTARSVNGINFDTSEGPCSKFEIYGCLHARHRRAQHLGIYSLVPKRQQLGSPVYVKNTLFRATWRPVYLSRYNSSRFINGTWVVGSKVGSGLGWFGVNDQATEPEFITGIWFSTSGNRLKPWRPEPEVAGRCVGAGYGSKSMECNLGDERGPLGTNWQSANLETPLYELELKRPYGENLYQPKGKLIVEIFTNNRALRFKSVYLSIHNDAGDCGLPILKRARHKFNSRCGGKILSRTGKRMKRIVFHFIAPPRGCLTFRALLISVTGEVYYDNNMKGSLQPRPLTRKICHQGYRKPPIISENL
uniref:uncharacterized protein LOC120340326 n=1 Tax=Styela clava TaxID=7725 RepID=UPI00193A8637|nr:uncharacterized protein LOC120340326 [Styela clava]